MVRRHELALTNLDVIDEPREGLLVVGQVRVVPSAFALAATSTLCRPIGGQVKVCLPSASVFVVMSAPGRILHQRLPSASSRRTVTPSKGYSCLAEEPPGFHIVIDGARQVPPTLEVALSLLLSGVGVDLVRLTPDAVFVMSNPQL